MPIYPGVLVNAIRPIRPTVCLKILNRFAASRSTNSVFDQPSLYIYTLIFATMRRRYYLSIVLSGIMAGCSSPESTQTPTVTSTPTPQSGYGGTPTVSTTATPNDIQTPASTATKIPTSTPTAGNTQTDTSTPTPSENGEYGTVRYGEGGYGGTR